MTHPSKNGFMGEELRKVLLIAEDHSLRSLVWKLLERVECGCSAVAAEEVNATFARASFDAVIVDADQPQAAIEGALSIIREGRPAMWARILVISNEQTSPGIRELMERHCLREISREHLQQQLWTALQDVIAPQPASDPALHRIQANMQTAELRFDSSRGSMIEGLRGFRANCRQLIFQHRSSTVDLLIEPREDSGRIAITGQVLHSPKKEDDEDSLPVLLVSGVRTMIRTSTNLSGEFCFESAPLQDACVEMRLGEGEWVSFILGELDWAVRRVPE